MKTLLTILLFGILQQTLGQVTEAENKLKEQAADTTSGWKKGGVIVLNLSQISLTNWAAGGENSFSANELFSVFANYKRGNLAWDNSVDIGYGFMNQEGKTKKTDDKVDILSKIGKKASKNLYYAALFNFKTQMTPGYHYPNDSVKISNLLAPGYFVGALGMDFKPNGYISAFLAPLTGKLTVVADQKLADAGAFGVDKATYDTFGNMISHGKTTRTEFGGYLRVIFSKNDFKKEILKSVSLTSKLDLFSNYLKDPGKIFVNWENQIVLKVNKYLAVNINTNLLYDYYTKFPVDKNKDGTVDAMESKVQFKEILGIGFAYKF
jgi:hypothetical protein